MWITFVDKVWDTANSMCASICLVGDCIPFECDVLTLSIGVQKAMWDVWGDTYCSVGDTYCSVSSMSLEKWMFSWTSLCLLYSYMRIFRDDCIDCVNAARMSRCQLSVLDNGVPNNVSIDCVLVALIVFMCDDCYVWILQTLTSMQTGIHTNGFQPRTKRWYLKCALANQHKIDFLLLVGRNFF